MLIYNYAGHFGLGDMIRSIFAFFVYCRIHNILFRLNFQDHKIREYIHDHYKAEAANIDYYVNYTFIDKHTPDFTVFLNTIKDPSLKNEQCLVVQSNLFDFVSFADMNHYKEDFKRFLVFKEPVANDVKYHLAGDVDDFCAIHVRCGDKYMTNVNCPTDSRANPNKIIHEIKIAKKYLENKYGLKVYVFTDNYLVKKEFIKNTFDTYLGHTSIREDEESVLDSIVEFVLMGFAVETITMTNSGFSFWSSFIYNVPLYKYVKDSEPPVVPFLVSDLKY